MPTRLGLRLTLLATGLSLLGAGVTSAPTAGAQPSSAPQKFRATANISGCTEKGIGGQLILAEVKSSEGVKVVTARLKVRGLPEGEHAVHLHENASCDPCSAAGGHFDPGPNSNSSPDGNHPYHMGDLVNVDVRKSGRGGFYTLSTRVTLSPGPLSIFDPDGSPSSAIIIHVDPDSYCPDGEAAGCAGGARAACGVIKLDR